jgi:N-acetylneuraminic acid mutarotase
LLDLAATQEDHVEVRKILYYYLNKTNHSHTREDFFISFPPCRRAILMIGLCARALKDRHFL